MPIATPIVKSVVEGGEAARESYEAYRGKKALDAAAEMAAAEGGSGRTGGRADRGLLDMQAAAREPVRASESGEWPRQISGRRPW